MTCVTGFAVAVAVAVASGGCGALLSTSDDDDHPTVEDAGVDATNTVDAPTTSEGGSPTEFRNTPEKLTQGDGLLIDLEQDDTSLYFVSFDPSAVIKIDKDGKNRVGLVPGVLEPSTFNPTSVAVRDGFVWWGGYTNAAYGGVNRMPSGGGMIQNLDACNTVFSVMPESSSRVFVVTGDCGAGPRIRRIDIGGTTTTSALDDPGEYEYGLYGWGDLDQDHVYWVSRKQLHSIAKTFIDGEAFTTLRSVDATNWQAIRVDDRIYALAGSGLYAFSKDGATSTDLVTNLESTAARGGIALDATHVYFTDATRGRVLRVPRAGGPAETLVSGQDAPTSVAVDAQYLYWANLTNGGSVWRLKR